MASALPQNVAMVRSRGVGGGRDFTIPVEPRSERSTASIELAGCHPRMPIRIRNSLCESSFDYTPDGQVRRWVSPQH